MPVLEKKFEKNFWEQIVDKHFENYENNIFHDVMEKNQKKNP